jgi:hypothetical protein
MIFQLRLILRMPSIMIPFSSTVLIMSVPQMLPQVIPSIESVLSPETPFCSLTASMRTEEFVTVIRMLAHYMTIQVLLTSKRKIAALRTTGQRLCMTLRMLACGS